VQQEEMTSFNRIAVVPFLPVAPEDARITAIRCPLCGSVIKTEKLPPDAEKVVEDVFLSALKERRGIQLIPPEITGAAFDRISGESIKQPLKDVIKKVGTELNADAVIVGYVFRYTERVGYSYSVEHPASVAFEIHLVKTSNGAIVWKGIFDKTQRSLTENMFQAVPFFKGHGQWLTAKQMVSENMDALLENFPGAK
jgi:hypothetical protein